MIDRTTIHCPYLTEAVIMEAVAFAVIACGLLIYLVPAIVAWKRGVSGSGILFVLNCLIGWTVLGWMAMLLWAVAGDTHAAEAYRRRLARQAIPATFPARKPTAVFRQPR